MTTGLTLSSLGVPAEATSPDELRKQLRPEESIVIINEVVSILRDDYNSLNKNQIDALKLQADIQFRRLAKVIPDLKLMEHNVGDTANKVSFVINLDGGTVATK